MCLIRVGAKLCRTPALQDRASWPLIYEFRVGSGAVPLYQFFIENNLQSTFTETVSLLKIITTMPTTEESNQIKSLLLSHHHSTSTLVSEILMSVLQTVQKKTTTTIYIWTDSAKKTTNNLHMDRQCKKNNKQFTYGQTVQKNCTGAFTVLQTVQKKKMFTYGTVHMGQYIFTDCTEDNVQNTHTYTQYT